MLVYQNQYYKFIVDEQLEDGRLILGRKNDFSQPGIILVINENSLKDIVYNNDEKPFVNLIYSFTEVGFHSEKQFLTINIKNKF